MQDKYNTKVKEIRAYNRTIDEVKLVSPRFPFPFDTLSLLCWFRWQKTF